MSNYNLIGLLFLSLEIAVVCALLLTELLPTMGENLSRFCVVLEVWFQSLHYPGSTHGNDYRAEHSVL